MVTFEYNSMRRNHFELQALGQLNAPRFEMKFARTAKALRRILAVGVIQRLDKCEGVGKIFTMHGVFQAFARVLMLVIAVSFGAPTFAVALTNSDCSRECCCADSCHCPMSDPCGPSCREAQAPSSDKQSPLRQAGAPVVRLVVVADAFPAAAPGFLLPAIFDRCDLNASPPLGGNPQQAVLRLWRI